MTVMIDDAQRVQEPIRRARGGDTVASRVRAPSTDDDG